MNTKILLGLTLVAVLTMAVMSPAVAEAITGIKKTEIKVKDGEIDKLKFHLDDKVEEDTFGGYAIFTGGAVVAYTSHPTVYDSTSQTAPTSAQIGLPIGAIAAGCNVTPDIACGGEWHSHLVVPDIDSPYCDFASISELSFNEPADKVKAKGKSVEGKDIAIGTGGFVGAISGELQDFTVGTPDQQPGAAFDLNTAFHDDTLRAICIGDVSSETDALCAELGSATGGVAFRDLYNVSGDPRLEISEFPYSDALWTIANTNVAGAVNPTVVGGGELNTWYLANCIVAP